MGIVVGFIAGYILGARGGREKFDELREAWQVIANSKEAQMLVMAGTTLLARAFEQGKEPTGESVAPEFQALLAGGSSPLTGAPEGTLEQAKGPTSNGVVAGLVKQLTQVVAAAVAPRRDA